MSRSISSPNDLTSLGLTRLSTRPLLDGEGVCVSLDAPPENILDGVMMQELCRLLEALEQCPQLKLICFTGAGAHFSYGASVEEHLLENGRPLLAAFFEIFRRLARLSVVTVAAVRGRCLGGGMELAVACTRVVAHPDAVFAQPEIKLGVLAPVAAIVLPFKVGQSRADEITVTGRKLLAKEALSFGIVDQIASDPMSAVETWAHARLADKSAASLRLALRASRWHFNRLLLSGLEAVEQLYLEELMGTRDASEGLRSFLEHRPPRWENC